jgi:hypothetical protein
MLLFKVLGGWIRGLYLMGFGGFWLAISYFMSRGGDVGTNPTVMGAGVLGGLTFAGGVAIIIRSLAMTSERKPLPEGSTGWRDDGTRAESNTGFDPDAAIARYLQKKPELEPAEQHEAPHKLASAPRAMPSFGRKQV